MLPSYLTLSDLSTLSKVAQHQIRGQPPIIDLPGLQVSSKTDARRQLLYACGSILALNVVQLPTSSALQAPSSPTTNGPNPALPHRTLPYHAYLPCLPCLPIYLLRRYLTGKVLHGSKLESGTHLSRCVPIRPARHHHHHHHRHHHHPWSSPALPATLASLNLSLTLADDGCRRPARFE